MNSLRRPSQSTVIHPHHDIHSHATGTLRRYGSTSVIRLLWAALAAFGSSGTACAQSAMPEELVPLQGTWIVSAAEQDGSRLETLQEAKFTIGEDSFELQFGDLAFRGKIRIRIDTSPKQIDLVLTSGRVWRGIYVATAKLLRINYVADGASAERPKLFSTSVDAPGVLLVMRRT
jgi:uncharacterized protein (TIGR03067 family)